MAVTEELEPWVARVIDTALLKHMTQCPVAERVRRLELRFVTLVALLVGSGIVGGIISKVITGGAV